MKLKLFALSILLFSSVKGQNLLQNPSFESFTGTLPNSWSLIYGASSQETTTINQGSSSLKGTLTSPVEFQTPSFWIAQDFILSDLDEYTLSFDYFLPGSISISNVENVYFDLANLQNDNAFFIPQLPPFFTPKYGSWQTTTFKFKVIAFRNGATSTNIRLTLSAKSFAPFGEGVVYFDNVSISKVSTLSDANFNLNSNLIKSISNDAIVIDEKASSFSYAIYAIDGKKVSSKNANLGSKINISELSKGVYVLKLNDKNTSKTVKFIKG
jgi:hypothetical protein